MHCHVVRHFTHDEKLCSEDISLLRVNPNSGHDTLQCSYVTAVPVQAWSGPEVSRKLRFPDFMTTAQEGGKVVRLTHRPHIPPGNSPGTHFC